jgi:hypothetical protein
MKPTRKHLVGVAAVLSTIAVAVPISPASAAAADAPGSIVVSGVAGSPIVTVPVAGKATKFVTIGTATFTNTNIQVSGGD